MLIPSVSLRLLESTGGPAWYLITVPEGTEHGVAAELHAEIVAQGGSACVWPGHELGSAPVTIMVIAGDAVSKLPAYLDTHRSTLANWGVLAFVIEHDAAGRFLHDAPHVASFVGGRVIATTAEDDDAPPEYVARRLDSLREAYGMTDAQAREAFESGRHADDIYFLEWMVLLEGARSGG